MATQVINPYKVIREKTKLFRKVGYVWTVQRAGELWFCKSEEQAKQKANELFSLLLHENL